MKKVIIATAAVAGIFIAGCAETPMATSVIDMAGNKKVAGWGENNNTKPKPVIKIVKCKPVKDSDKDGVPDNFDKCPNTPANMLVDHNGCPIITTLRLNFDFNKAVVKKIYYPELKKVAEILKNNPSLKIEVAGYTDNIGSAEYNLKLSQKRAEAVKKILVNVYGINPQRIVAKGYGEAYPLVPNTTETNRALNRRVEIVNITNQK
ncbi:thrombospondin [Nautilia sp. PV-1]|uniref:OmpA family protein n=1 Tax=Nautilia sp. PV-1 TaxID=2579250 RepID=UPI000FD8B841|nr:OmpA family protein [Nautilia sp. PV-1]AZV47048.1 thrombospondin [Nautilia sp. PV-1]